MIYEIKFDNRDTLEEVLDFSVKNGASLIKKDVKRLLLVLRDGNDSVVPYAQSKNCSIRENCETASETEAVHPRERELVEPPHSLKF